VQRHLGPIDLLPLLLAELLEGKVLSFSFWGRFELDLLGGILLQLRYG
jgi:hypothetical protein